jgi:hypothetical protein
MARKTKSWTQKLAHARAKASAPHRFRCEKSGKDMSIPSIAEVEDLMRAVGAGRLVTVRQISDALTAKHGVDLCCPLTTGIFAWLIANGAEEAERLHGMPAPPWWRTLKAGGELNPKYPGGGALQRGLLEAVGHRVVTKGKRIVVEGYQRALAEL